MSFEADFKSMMPHSITVETWSGYSANAAPAYNSAVAYSGLVVNRARQVRDANGQETVSDTTIYLNTTAALSPKDRITLPAGFTPNQPLVIRVDRRSDDEGLHHTVIYAGQRG